MREIKITEKGQEYVIKVNKITYGVYSNIMQEVSQMKVIGNVTDGSFNIFKFRKLIVKSAVVLPEGLVLDNLSLENGQLLEHEALVENGLETAEGDEFFRGGK